jgi:hypothetical protein
MLLSSQLLYVLDCSAAYSHNEQRPLLSCCGCTVRTALKFICDMQIMPVMLQIAACYCCLLLLLHTVCLLHAPADDVESQHTTSHSLVNSACERTQLYLTAIASRSQYCYVHVLLCDAAADNGIIPCSAVALQQYMYSAASKFETSNVIKLTSLRRCALCLQGSLLGSSPSCQLLAHSMYLRDQTLLA